MDHHDHMNHDHVTPQPEEPSAHVGHEMRLAPAVPAAMEHDHGSMMEQDFRRRFFVVLVLTIPVLVLSPTIQSWAGYRLPNVPAANLILAAFASVIALYGGLPFFRGAATSLRARTADMDVLVSLAILSGYLYSLGATFLFTASDFYWEISTLVLFLLFGHWMEMRSVSSASGALRELVKLIPPTANRVRPDGSIEEVATASLVVGDVVLVRPGEKVPIDGVVIEGASSVNEALVTGESKPVPKREGDEVLGGTLNGDGALRVRVTKTGGETALAQIMNLVRQAQETKPRVQRLADRAATALTLIAVALGIATFLYWFGFAKADSLFSLTLMITVFVIACPHALGLAIPTVTVLATTMGAQRGLLIRNAEGLEVAKDVHTVVFDKTGTLTRGEFGVSDVIALGGWTETDLLRIAAAVERNSEHVIAKAIVARAESQGLERPEVFDFAAIPGKGARAKVERHAVALG
ncbi:MAG TPA: heavy metal translocating P-type ATPase, partial [Thermoplasmata archaeon]|nr:heavy metal translocating P-type ATPase [Thermoplasmata archaeon]